MMKLRAAERHVVLTVNPNGTIIAEFFRNDAPINMRNYAGWSQVLAVISDTAHTDTKWDIYIRG